MACFNFFPIHMYLWQLTKLVQKRWIAIINNKTVLTIHCNKRWMNMSLVLMLFCVFIHILVILWTTQDCVMGWVGWVTLILECSLQLWPEGYFLPPFVLARKPRSDVTEVLVECKHENTTKIHMRTRTPAMWLMMPTPRKGMTHVQGWVEQMTQISSAHSEQQGI